MECLPLGMALGVGKGGNQLRWPIRETCSQKSSSHIPQASLDGLSALQLPTVVRQCGRFKCSGPTPDPLIRLLLRPGFSIARKVTVGRAQVRGICDQRAVSLGAWEKGQVEPGREGPALCHRCSRAFTDRCCSLFAF